MEAKRASLTLCCLALAGGLAAMPGCKGYDWSLRSWFDPSKTTEYPDHAVINPIFDTVGPTDRTDRLVPNSDLPKPEDLEYAETDYVIGPTDVLRISVLDLLTEGLETILERQVSYSGHIDLPLVEKPIKAAGLTQTQLVAEVQNAYRPDILLQPTVSVIVVMPRHNTFTALGAFARPGTYNILRRDFTLLEALGLAGDVVQANIEWVYVIRPDKSRKPAAPATPPATVPAEEALPPLPTLPPTAPAAPATRPGTLKERLQELEKFIPGTVMRPKGTGAGGEDERVCLSAVGTEPAASAPAGDEGQADLDDAAVTYKWIYSNGRWIRVSQSVKPTTRPLPVTQPAGAAGGIDKDPYGWLRDDLSKRIRIIAVNLPKLKAGNARMNIIVRPNDIVHVPTLQIGEFYVMGEVLRPGVYSLTGRKVTIKMAVAAAGNLGPLSWPHNSVLVRRVGQDQEQMQHLNINDIMAGKEPDIYLKPNDVIAVGTYWAAVPLAVWRNAFRMTYGFGFIYDRNYSEAEFEVPIFFPAKGWR